MIYSPAYNLMFFHLRKTGGTSIASALRKLDPKAHDPYQDRHLYPSRVRQRMPRQFEECLKFSVVRNPWDRMVSCYEYDRQNTSDFQRGGDLHGQTFAEYLSYRFDGCDGHWSTPQVGFLRGSPEKEWLTDRCLRFERLAEEWAQLLKDIKAGTRFIPLPHKRKTKRGPYRGYYVAETRQKVADVFWADIEAFGYRF